MSLSDVIADPSRKEAIIADGMRELEAEVEGLSGLKGKAVSGGYNAIRKMRPGFIEQNVCLLYTSPSPRDATLSRMPSSA